MIEIDLAYLFGTSQPTVFRILESIQNSYPNTTSGTNTIRALTSLAHPKKRRAGSENETGYSHVAVSIYPLLCMATKTDWICPVKYKWQNLNV
jgi:hypothetical protein